MVQERPSLRARVSPENRQSNVDRQVNMKPELEIELLQDKMNVLREQEITKTIQMLRQQQEALRRLEELLVQSGSERA